MFDRLAAGILCFVKNGFQVRSRIRQNSVLPRVDFKVAGFTRIRFFPWFLEVWLAVFLDQFYDQVMDGLVVRCPLPIQFSLPPMSQVALFVDHIDGWPHGIGPVGPILGLQVDQDGVVHRLFCGGGPHGGGIFLRGNSGV